MGKSRRKDLIIFIVLFIVTIMVTLTAVYLFCDSFTDGEEVSIIYNEDSSLNYKVLLKENDFYEGKYLGEEYNVIADAVDKINISFDYLFNTSKTITGKAYYTINSMIVAHQKSDDSNRKVWDYNQIIRDKDITLFEEPTTTMNLSDEFEIDYESYRKKMRDYQKKYAVSLEGNLIIEVGIKIDFDYNEFNSTVDLSERRLLLTIPLTESVFEIKKNVPESNGQELIEKKLSKINYLKLIGAFFEIFFSISMAVFLGKTIVKIFGFDSKYEKELNKILRTYNYIIVNVKYFDLSKYEKVLYVDSFENLLDAQSELRVPILYFNVRSKREDMFIVKYGNDLLVYKMESNLYEDDDVIEVMCDEI